MSSSSSSSSSSNRPPRHDGNNRSSSSSSSRFQATHSHSDSANASATNDHGRCTVNNRFRSILSHPLGLPLFYVLHDKEPSTLGFELFDKIFGIESKQAFHNDAAPSNIKTLDGILETALREWVITPNSVETHLTKRMSTLIELEFGNTGFHSAAEVGVKYENRPKDGKIDILLSNSSSSTPLAIIEVGLHDNEWWKKLDQNVKYLDSFGDHQRDPRLRFDVPLLFAVLTIEGEKTTKERRYKLGVFFCTPKERDDDCRMSLLAQFCTNNRQLAAKAFGRVLRATYFLDKWRNKTRVDKTVEYFSSNCCRVDRYVSSGTIVGCFSPPLGILFLIGR
jgi:hypothetical protein